MIHLGVSIPGDEDHKSSEPGTSLGGAVMAEAAGDLFGPEALCVGERGFPVDRVAYD